MQSDFHVKACQVKNSHDGTPPPHLPDANYIFIDSRGTARPPAAAAAAAQPGGGAPPASDGAALLRVIQAVQHTTQKR